MIKGILKNVPDKREIPSSKTEKDLMSLLDSKQRELMVLTNEGVEDS